MTTRKFAQVLPEKKEIPKRLLVEHAVLLVGGVSARDDTVQQLALVLLGASMVAQMRGQLRILALA